MKRQLFSLFVCIFLVVSWFSVFVTYSQTPVPEGIIEVEIPVRGTFVRAMDDWPYYGPGQKEYDEYLEVAVGTYTDFRIEDPAIVNLQSHGIFEGDTVYIGWRGGVYPDGAWNPADPGSRTMGLRENEKVPYGGLVGLFSTTSELEDIDVLNRVPGAIDFGDDFVTPETLWDGGRFEISQKLEEKNVDWYNGSLTTDIPEDFKIEPYTGKLIEIPRNAKFLFISLIDEYYRDNFESPNSLFANIEKDTDKDGIPDNWEINGIDINKDGEIDLDLSAMDADWEHKDIFVEIDYMGSSGGHDHRPHGSAINDVVQAFRNAPVKNPDNVQGINLHVIIDEELEHVDEITFDQFRTQIKTENFGTEDDDPNTIAAKKMVFHYCLFAHNQTGGGWSGRGEIRGDDFMVSLGGFEAYTGTRNQQAATFMHELGHNLGLHHGGNEEINYKPNYISIMNYLFQLDVFGSGRPLDFSIGDKISLTESGLNEHIGIGDPVKTVWRLPNGRVAISDGSMTIDWNRNGNLSVGVRVNLNNFPQEPSTDNNETLTDYNDWENLFYRFKNTANFATGEENPHNELTFKQYEDMMDDAKDIIEVISPEPTGTDFLELQVDVSALGTFLRADPIMEEGGSPVEPPTIIDLEATGILGEKWIFITYSGKIFHAIDWGDGDPKEDGYINLIGIFSTTTELESIDKLNRVPGAIASNTGFETDETYFTEMQTDIPEDFLSGDHTGTTIEIPDGAKFLFLCNPDVYYPDNGGTFQVTIKKLEANQSTFPIETIIIIIVAIAAILFIVFLFLRKRKKTKLKKHPTPN
ncbi:hypothetical protein ACFLRN_09780 [Thermoproteota archaeon]